MSINEYKNNDGSKKGGGYLEKLKEYSWIF